MPRGTVGWGKRGKKPPPQPSRPHPGERPNRLDSEGHLMEREEQIEKWRRQGICPLCGITRTHKKHFGVMMKPLTIQGLVYKGKCLKCMSMTQAQNELNEPMDAMNPRDRASVRQGMGSQPPQPRGVQEFHNSYGDSGTNRVGGSRDNISHPPNNYGVQSDSYDLEYQRNNSGQGPRGVHHEYAQGMPPGHGDPYYHQGRNEIERHHNNHHNNADHGNGGPGGEYFDTLKRQHSNPNAEHMNGVPSMVGGFGDDVSVISLDPSIMTTDSGSSNRSKPKNNQSESLGKITEERGSNDVSSSSQDQLSQEQGNASLGNMSYMPSVSNHSATKVGAAAVGADDTRYNRLLERKLAGNTPAGSRKQPPQEAAPGPSETSHVHFRNNNDSIIPPKPAPTRDLSARIREKTGMSASGHYRSKSDNHHTSSPTSPAQSHVRSLTHGDASVTMNSDIQRNISRLEETEEKMRKKSEEYSVYTKRTMSSEAASDEFHRRYSQKVNAMNAKIVASASDESTSNDGNTDRTKPGVKRLSDDAYITLLDRKLSREGGGNNSKETHAPATKNAAEFARRRHVTGESMSESEERRFVDNCSNCNELIDALKRVSSQASILLTLEKLRNSLLATHGLLVANQELASSMNSSEGSGLSRIAFTSSGWAKIFMMVMSSNASSVIVQSDMLQTLWTIVTLHPRYTSDLTNADMKQIVTSMETYTKDEGVQEYSCGLLSCIAASQKHALRLLGMYNGKFMHRLMVALTLSFKGRKGNVQMNALKALFLLSSASYSAQETEQPFSLTMGRYAENDPQAGSSDISVNAITTVLRTMKHHSRNVNVQTYGNRLLWNIFVPEAIVDPDYVDILRGQTFQHIEDAMKYHNNSQAFHETAVCLLSKMSCSGNDSRCREAFLHVVVDTMKTYPKSTIIALHGCQCLANMCARSETLLESKPVVDSIPEIISLMKTFQDHIGVQSEACAAIAAICIWSPSNKERVHRYGGIDSINCAYDSFSMAPYEDHCVVTKIRAIVALTTIAVDPIAMSDMEEKGLITKYERLLEKETNMPQNLRMTIHDFLLLASDEDDKERKLVFREGLSEEETCDCLRANLRMVTTPEFTPNRTTYLREKTIESMNIFPGSASIHENGCKLLAFLFDIASDDETAQGGIVSEELDLLEALSRSLAEHKSNPDTAAAALSAIQNFCVLVDMLGIDDATDLSDALSRCLTVLLHALAVYRDDEHTLERVTGALWALCTVSGGGVSMSSEIANNIGLIIGAMSRFPNSNDLNMHGIGILGMYFEKKPNDVMDFVTDDLVAVLVSFIENDIDNDDAADLIDIALNVILIIANTGFTAVTTLLRNEKVVGAVVSCMFKFPNSLSVQGAGIDILTNVALDNFLRAEVCSRGGTSRIIFALDNLRHDPIVTCKAFAALANLISGAHVEILRAEDSPSTTIFIRAMAEHPNNLPIQINAAYAMWALSARDDWFKDEIVRLGGAEAVAGAMSRFVASKQMQAKGFVAIWSMAVPRHLKTSVGSCGIEPVVNGLSAHIMSEKACEEALGCLKCLSTIPVNKELLEDHGAVDLIYACMWLHSENSSVCKAALAALCNISVNVDSNQVCEITSEDLDSVVQVMRVHQTVKAVQESAIILLRNFTFSPTNVLVLERSPFLASLVQSAMSKHNDHFQGRAEDLLRVLPPPTSQ